MSPFTFVPAYGLPVYASQCTLAASTQDSVRGCWLDFPAAAISDGWLTYAYKAQPAQSRTCRFPASGSSRESFAHSGVAVDDPSCWERVSLQEVRKPIPWESAPASRQQLLPGPCNLVGVPAKSSKVTRYAVVGIVAPAFSLPIGHAARGSTDVGGSFFAVTCLTTFLPFRDFPQMWQKPRRPTNGTKHSECP